jgi:hypothetical protein
MCQSKALHMVELSQLHFYSDFTHCIEHLCVYRTFRMISSSFSKHGKMVGGNVKSESEYFVDDNTD